MSVAEVVGADARREAFVVDQCRGGLAEAVGGDFG